jgi:succinate dehydrogenase / fumarate reductase, membrane anchor subunit
MAVTTPPSRPSATPGALAGSPRSRRPKQSFETWSWFFMRVSGLVLIFLALAHFAITHIVNDVVETDAAFVYRRWDNPLWRTFDWVLLALALLHGLNGLRWSIDDYIRSRPARAAVKAVLYTVSGVLFTYGTFTIVAFQ